MKVGDKVIWVYDWIEGPICEGTLTKLTSDLVFVDHQHKPEDCIFRAYVFPAEAYAEAEQALKERQGLKAALDDSMRLVYQLGNKHHEWRKT